MIRDDAKIIVTPTGVSLKEALTSEEINAINEAHIYDSIHICNSLETILVARKAVELEGCQNLEKERVDYDR